MAIYRLEKKSISRGSNHNLVAAVAYRAGAKFTDTNKLNPKATTHDYTKKTDIAHSEIILPDELAEQLTQA
ncbi:MobA/MobL family protein, partial [Psychrobacter celer]|uniref:MobA/MobL family protein n=1 Tax=Psychrobacter celer TaxID=306572 RepID=UPI003FCF8B0E